jgi:hypothetical protein
VVSDNRVHRRPAIVLWLVLCVSAPQLPWGSIELRASQSGCSDLAAPANSSSQLVRAIAKAEKSVSAGCVAPPESPSLHPSVDEVATTNARPPDPPSLALDCPPLAPRPPPLA